MKEMTEPDDGAKVGAKVMPSEAWLARHRERMHCARPMPSAEKGKQGESGREGEKPKIEKKEGSQSLGQSLGLGDGQSLGLGDKPLGLGDGWGW